MKLTKLFTLVLFALSILSLNAQCPSQTEYSSLLFDLNACASNTTNGTNTDYSEFTAVSSNPSSCASATVIGGSLYRFLPQKNVHSCTPGVDETPAMCVSGERDCNFSYNTSKEVRFDIQVTPSNGGFMTLESLNFYEMAPDYFEWIGGASGDNDYPTLYSVRVLANSLEVFHSQVNATTKEWSLESFDFSGNPSFMVNTPTVFSFELLAYCAVGNGGPLSVWDLDNIEVTTSCSSQGDVFGGTLEGGPFDLCVGDGVDDYLTVDDVNVWDNIGSNSMYLLTDMTGTILVVTSDIGTINFDLLAPGSCMYWHVAHENNFQGAVVGNNVSQLMGCFSLSNAVTINKSDCGSGCAAAGGMLTGANITFCVDDGLPNVIVESDLGLTGNVGSNMQWVITDLSGNITALPGSLGNINFEGSAPGVCLVWNLAYENGIIGANVGNNANQLMGCFSLSNPITINKENCTVGCAASGGSITGGPFEFCVTDGLDDIILDAQIVLGGNLGTNSQWVVTDNLGNILGLPNSISEVNFEGTDLGQCLIWHLSYEDDLTGLVVGSNANQLGGCFGLSNPIMVTRIDCIEPCQVNGGIVGGGPYEYCIGDGNSDFIKDGQIILYNEFGPNFQWLLTDVNGNIISLPDHYTDLEFDDSAEGTCLIYHISYDIGIQGLFAGSNLNDISGCFDISNSVEIIKTDCTIDCMPVGGNLLGGPFTFCVEDDVVDEISDAQIILEMNEGPNDRYLLTLADGTLLAVASNIGDINFDILPVGTCFISNISFYTGLLGLEVGNNINTDLQGCWGFSNQITVTKMDCSVPCSATASTLTGGPFTFCVGDGEADMILPGQLVVSGGSGPMSSWIITDSNGNILSLPFDYLSVDFDSSPLGICLLWQIRFEPGLTGLAVGNNASDLAGCFALSNAVEINRTDVGCEEEELVCPTAVINSLFGIVDNNLVILDEEVGTIKQIIPLLGGLSSDYAGFTYNSADGNYYAITGRLTEPTLVTIDVQTGMVTEVGVIVDTAQPTNPFTISESLEFNPDNGLMYISCGRNDAGQNFFSRGLYTINPSNAEVDLVANFSGSCQTEADGMVYNQGTMYYMDGCPDPVQFGTLDLNTGQQTLIENVVGVASASRLASDPNTGTIFYFNSVDRSLYTLDNSGQASVIGVSYADGVFGEALDELAFGPRIDDNTFGGIILGGQFTFCISDSEPDFFEDGELQLFSEYGPNLQWVVTNDESEILMLPNDYTEVDFGGFSPDICFMWHLSYNSGIQGLEVGENINELVGCFDLSNPIIVEKVEDGPGCDGIVSEEEDELSFVVASNPIEGELNLLDINLISDSGVVRIYDSMGQLIVENDVSTTALLINSSSWASGIYFVSLQSGNKEVLEKIIKID